MSPGRSSRKATKELGSSAEDDVQKSLTEITVPDKQRALSGIWNVWSIFDQTRLKGNILSRETAQRVLEQVVPVSLLARLRKR